MRFVTFEQEGTTRIGVLAESDLVVDLTTAAARSGGGGAAAFASMQTLIEAGEAGLDGAQRAIDAGDHVLRLAGVRLLAPLPRPQSLRDAFTFPGHIRQSYLGMQRLRARISGEPMPNMPAMDELPEVYRKKAIYHKCNPLTVVGPGVEVIWPAYSHYMDFELEIAVVIGKRGVDIGIEEAPAHIFGYTIFNDFSARDAQMEEMPGMMGPAKGKDFDRSNAMGPCIATADEFSDVHDIKMRAFVNGERWAEGSNAEMMHRFEDVIAYLSRGETLHPGEIIGSGTMTNGCGLEQDRFLNDGDEVSLEIEGIGILTNTVRRR